MSDHSELKEAATRIVEVQTSQDVAISKLFDEFDALASPEAVLELIAEVDRLTIAAKYSEDVDAIPENQIQMVCYDLAVERDQLKAEVEALRSQVTTLQSDANSWQSGYDEGRRMGTKTAMDERDQLRKDAERYRWLCRQRSKVWRCIANTPSNQTDEYIDDGMTKGSKP